MIRLLITFFILLVVLPLFAQKRNTIYISQYVKDSFTKYGIRNALITIADTAGNVIDTLRTSKGSGGHDAQIWSLEVPRRAAIFMVKAEHPDYETSEMRVEMRHPSRLNSFLFPDLLLKKKSDRMKEVLLEGVTVKATRVQLCYKGDTIEVDARAFKLSEGSMLDALVRSVPGCELRENGDIYMNGKKVDYLTLNGKDFFKGNNRIMLDNLPYYTVDKLQFYNQQSEHSQFVGKDMERADYVMNVKMKREYSVGLLGNVEVGAGTRDRWLARTFELRFTDNSRLTLFANTNNMNESRQPGSDGGWEAANSPTGNTRLYNIGGELMVDDKNGNYREQVKADVSWQRRNDEIRTATEQFLQAGTAYGRRQQTSSSHTFNLNADNDLTMKRLGVKSVTHVDYTRTNADSKERTGQFSSSPADYGSTVSVLDDIFSTSTSDQLRSLMVNHTSDTSHNYDRKFNLRQELSWHKELPWGDDIVLSANGKFREAKTRLFSDYQLATADSQERQNRRRYGFDRGYDFGAGVSYSFHFLNKWHLTLSDNYWQQRNDTKSDLFRLDSDSTYIATGILPSVIDYARLQDFGNSWHSIYTVQYNQLSMMLHSHKYDQKQGRYTSFTANIPAQYTWASEDYTRGQRHSSARDHRWLFQPNIHFEYNTRKWHDTYTFNYRMDMRSPDLTQKVDFTDTSNPLSIVQGNPNLRPSLYHNLDFTFSSRFGAQEQFISFRTTTIIMSNLMAESVNYDKQTGAYTYMPVNVDGNWNSQNRMDYRRALTHDRRLKFYGSTAFDYFHQIDIKDEHQSQVNRYTTSQQAKVEYRYGKLQVSVMGSLAWNKIHATENISSFDFNYGTALTCELPLSLLLTTDMKMYSRRGYSEASLNTNNLLWNAQIARSFCKGRLIASVKAFDLLHQLSQTYATINSQARTETWRLSLPNYVVATVLWKFHGKSTKQ